MVVAHGLSCSATCGIFEAMPPALAGGFLATAPPGNFLPPVGTSGGVRGEVKWSESCSVMSDSLQPRGLYSPWNSSDQKSG